MLKRIVITAVLLVAWMPIAAQSQQAPVSTVATVQLNMSCATDATCDAERPFMRAQHDIQFAATAPVLDLRAPITLQNSTRKHRLIGAAAGFVVGATLTHYAMKSGGSRSLCDRSRNQDAISEGECRAVTIGGGVVGAGLGFVIGGAVGRRR